jgi:hypothetical protein
VHVAVKSAPEALTEVISGRADFYFCPIGTAFPFIRDGKLAGLVVNSGERAPQLPDLPTTAQAGLANAVNRFWIGLFAPHAHHAVLSIGCSSRLWRRRWPHNRSVGSRAPRPANQDHLKLL